MPYSIQDWPWPYRAKAKIKTPSPRLSLQNRLASGLPPRAAAPVVPSPSTNYTGTLMWNWASVQQKNPPSPPYRTTHSPHHPFVRRETGLTHKHATRTTQHRTRHEQHHKRPHEEPPPRTQQRSKVARQRRVPPPEQGTR